MAGFSNANRELFQSEQGKQNLRAVAEYIVSISRRQDVPPPDAALAAQGKELFESATWPAGELAGGLSCMDCHSTFDADQAGPQPDDDGGGFPILTGYGSRAWLEHFISDPAKHYGEKNQMPAYGERLSQKDLELLTRWLTGEYYPTKVRGSRIDDRDG
jgi:mono/diheme cytochrome c family protein